VTIWYEKADSPFSPDRIEAQDEAMEAFEYDGVRLFAGEGLAVRGLYGDWSWADGEADVITGVADSPDVVLIDFYDRAELSIFARLTVKEAQDLASALTTFLASAPH